MFAKTEPRSNTRFQRRRFNMASIRRLGLFYNCPLMDPIVFSQQYYDKFVRCAAGLEETLAFIWRVKKWSFEPTLTEGFVINSNIYRDNLALIQSEKDLVCRPLAFAHFFEVQKETEEDGLPLTLVSRYNYSPSLYAAQKWQNNLYSPGHFFYEQDFFFSDTFTPNLYIEGQGPRPPSPFLDVSSQSPLDGDRPWEEMVRVGYLTFSITLTNDAGTVVMQPQEYWPYDPGDGAGPIYDSVTGAKLREFPE